MTRDIQFDPLVVESTPAWYSFRERERTELSRQLPDTLERLEGALHFAFELTNVAERDLARARLFFRAALAEYSSIEDISKRERPSLRFELRATGWPLPHILKVLRNLHVHLKSVEFRHSHQSLEFRGTRNTDPVDVVKWCVSDLSADDLLKVRAFQGSRPEYTKDQAEQLVAWFDDAQEHFGIPDLLWRAVHDARNRLTDSLR